MKDRQMALRLRQAEIQAERESAIVALAAVVEPQYRIRCDICECSEALTAGKVFDAAEMLYAFGYRIEKGKVVCQNCQ
jgi:hypothetical protein